MIKIASSSAIATMPPVTPPATEAVFDALVGRDTGRPTGVLVDELPSPEVGEEKKCAVEEARGVKVGGKDPEFTPPNWPAVLAAEERVGLTVGGVAVYGEVVAGGVSVLVFQLKRKG